MAGDTVLANKRECSIDGCNRVPKARGWCLMHYKRWRAHGDPTKRFTASPELSTDDLILIIEQRTDVSGGSTGCHPWTWTVNAAGYGVLPKKYNGSRLVHRAVLSMKLNRPLASTESSRHECDNPPCCNPTHLLEGTQAQNVDDAWSRGRVHGGKYNQDVCKWGHKLTEDNVRLKSHKSTRREFMERVCIKCRQRCNKEQAARRKAARAVSRKERCNNGR